MVKVDRRSDSDSDEEIGVRKKQRKKNAAFFAICIIVIAALIFAIWSACCRNKCPRAGMITQCATKYEMIDGVEFTSEVNCTTVKEKRNCKPGKKDKTDSTDPRDHQRVRF